MKQDQYGIMFLLFLVLLLGGCAEKKELKAVEKMADHSTILQEHNNTQASSTADVSSFSTQELPQLEVEPEIEVVEVVTID